MSNIRQHDRDEAKVRSIRMLQNQRQIFSVWKSFVWFLEGDTYSPGKLESKASAHNLKRILFRWQAIAKKSIINIRKVAKMILLMKFQRYFRSWLSLFKACAYRRNRSASLFLIKSSSMVQSAVTYRIFDMRVVEFRKSRLERCGLSKLKEYSKRAHVSLIHFGEWNNRYANFRFQKMSSAFRSFRSRLIRLRDERIKFNSIVASCCRNVMTSALKFWKHIIYERALVANYVKRKLERSYFRKWALFGKVSTALGRKYCFEGDKRAFNFRACKYLRNWRRRVAAKIHIRYSFSRLRKQAFYKSIRIHFKLWRNFKLSLAMRRYNAENEDVSQFYQDRDFHVQDLQHRRIFHDNVYVFEFLLPI
jgi:hypothetical protein